MKYTELIKGEWYYGEWGGDHWWFKPSGETKENYIPVSEYYSSDKYHGASSAGFSDADSVKNLRLATQEELFNLGIIHNLINNTYAIY